MLWNNKKKLIRTINSTFLDQADIIKRKIDELEKECEKRNINKKFEQILSDVYVLHKQLNLISYSYTEEILNEKRILEQRLTAISQKIKEYGTEIKCEVLNKLDKIDKYHNFNIKNDEIKGTLEWVWDNLELDMIEHEDNLPQRFNEVKVPHRRGKIISCGVSDRQIYSYEACIGYIIEKNIPEAIHSLYEFTEEYRNKLNEPFNAYERISIRNMIKAILKSL